MLVEVQWKSKGASLQHPNREAADILNGLHYLLHGSSRTLPQVLWEVHAVRCGFLSSSRPPFSHALFPFLCSVWRALGNQGSKKAWKMENERDKPGRWLALKRREVSIRNDRSDETIPSRWSHFLYGGCGAVRLPHEWHVRFPKSLESTSLSPSCFGVYSSKSHRDSEMEKEESRSLQRSPVIISPSSSHLDTESNRACRFSYGLAIFMPFL